MVLLKYGYKLLHGSLLKAFMLLLVFIVVSLLGIKMDNCAETIVPNLEKCPFYLGSKNALDFDKPIIRFMFPFSPRNRDSLIKNVFAGLIEINLLRTTKSRALCVGEGSGSAALALRDLGLFDVESRHPLFSLLKTNELQYVDDTFDVVFTGEMDGLLVMEMERVLRPGGMGIMLVETREFYSGGLISSVLKRSNVVRACEIESLTVFVFKKRVKNPFVSLDSFNLPNNCASVTRNKPYMKYLEPLVDKSEQSYLPKYMNISSRNKLVYINVGVGELAKENIAVMMDPYCSNHHKAFDAFVIDHKTSVLTSLLTDHGITFIYDPSLSGSPVAQKIGPDDYANDMMEEEVFEFVPWFNETIDDGDFVVLIMDMNVAQLNILVEMFKTGAICSVDELFVKCSGDIGCKNFLESLRKTGLYVHELYGD